MDLLAINGPVFVLASGAIVIGTYGIAEAKLRHWKFRRAMHKRIIPEREIVPSKCPKCGMLTRHPEYH